jgi:hypothetical protein
MTNIMPSDAAIVALCAEIYQPPAIGGAFDYYDAGVDDGICWAVKRLDGFDVVVFRGSVTRQDWLRDVQALAMPSQWESPPGDIGIALGIQIQRDLLNSITGNDAGSLKVACAALWGDQLKIVVNVGALLGKIATGGLAF